MPERPYRILVTGSRDWDDADVLSFTLGTVFGDAAKTRGCTTPADFVLVHGACPTGADAMAAALVAGYGIPVEAHPADWATYGKAAGFRRNAEMVAAGADVCVAFIRNRSRGATHTADLAEKAGIPTRRVTRDGC